MTAHRNLIVTLGPLAVAYAMPFAYPILRERCDWRPEALGPVVPHVIMPPATQTDVVSSVSLLLFVIALAIVAVLPAEISKLWSASLRHRTSSYVVIFCYQAVLFLDVIRAYATDWWVYIWSVLRVKPIGASTWMEPPFISGNHHIWLSGVALLIAIVVITALEMFATRSPTAEVA